MTETELNALLAGITPANEAARAAAHAHWASLAKPLGGLGRLETMLEDAAALTGTAELAFSRRAVLVLCADNGVVAEGVSSAPQSVTKQQTINLMRGKTGAAVLAKHFGCGLTVCDVGVNADIFESTVLNRKIAYGTQNICTGPAMTREQTLQAILTGAEIARTVDADVIGVGEMGIGNTTTSPAASPPSGSSKASFGNSSVSVVVARTVVRPAFPNSENIPDGKSIDTTRQPLELIRRTTPSRGSVNSPRTPVPSSASTITVPSGSDASAIGRTDRPRGRRSRLNRHSSESSSRPNARYTAQEKPARCSIRATASPSPPLLPLPTKKASGHSGRTCPATHCAILSEARSIRAMLSIGSRAIV